MIKKILFYLIRIYQKTFSPDHGILSNFLPSRQGCRYVPTCSQYAQEVLLEFNLNKALILIFKRVLSCHPLSSRATYDPAPKQSSINFKTRLISRN